MGGCLSDRLILRAKALGKVRERDGASYASALAANDALFACGRD